MIQRELIKFFKLDKMKSAEINYPTKIVHWAVKHVASGT